MTDSPDAIHVDYEWHIGNLVSDETLEECSKLYREHYGVWSQQSPVNPGKRISLPAERIRGWLESGSSDLFIARLDGALVGYAIALFTSIEGKGYIGWVTQLVVHDQYRDQGIAKHLLSTHWAFSDYYAWGVVTASPYAVRALEKATRRRCRTIRICRDEGTLMQTGRSHIPFIGNDTMAIVQRDESRVFTRFYVDHSEIPEMLKRVTDKGAPWTLGELPEGWEWFAFTFRDQQQIALSDDEIADIVGTSDQVVRRAYARMFSDENHPWMRNTSYEIDFALEALEVQAGFRMIDVGCGTGRHSIELAKRGVECLGVDFVPENIERARQMGRGVEGASFIYADARSQSFGVFDAGICFYDVVGSFADQEDNRRLLENIASQLRPGGRLLLSVMNYVLTLEKARYTFEFQSDPSRVLQLPPSRTMERSGEVFDPEYYLLDTAEQVVYRREQFGRGEGPPAELLVRDRRYTRDDIEELCRAAGLRVIWSRHVHSGHWDGDLPPVDPHAKEILVLCQRDQYS